MSILEEAANIIYGDREKTYGHPSKNLECIADLWHTYLINKGDSTRINAKDVAVMMALLKIARLANNPNHHDSLVDGVGYLALFERCHEGDPF
jgi:hypothetical protein